MCAFQKMVCVSVPVSLPFPLPFSLNAHTCARSLGYPIHFDRGLHFESGGQCSQLDGYLVYSICSADMLDWDLWILLALR